MFAVALDAGLFSCLWMLEAERADAGFSSYVSRAFQYALQGSALVLADRRILQRDWTGNDVNEIRSYCSGG